MISLRMQNMEKEESETCVCVKEPLGLKGTQEFWMQNNI